MKGLVGGGGIRWLAHALESGGNFYGEKKAFGVGCSFCCQRFSYFDTRAKRYLTKKNRVGTNFIKTGAFGIFMVYSFLDQSGLDLRATNSHVGVNFEDESAHSLQKFNRIIHHQSEVSNSEYVKLDLDVYREQTSWLHRHCSSDIGSIIQT